MKIILSTIEGDQWPYTAINESGRAIADGKSALEAACRGASELHPIGSAYWYNVMCQILTNTDPKVLNRWEVPDFSLMGEDN